MKWHLSTVLALSAMLAACGESGAPDASATAAKAEAEKVDPCSYLTFEEVEAATGTRPVSAEIDTMGMSCSWIYNGKMMGQPAELPLVTVGVAPQRYTVPATFEQFRADFEEQWGQPWDGMTEVGGLGKYAWTDGQMLQAMSADGALVSVSSGYKMDLSESALRQVAQHALDRL